MAGMDRKRTLPSVVNPPFLFAFFCGPHWGCTPLFTPRPWQPGWSVRARERRHARRLVNFVNFRALAMLSLAALVASPALADTILLRPAQVFDGLDPHPHSGWSVLVDGDKIAAVGLNLGA